MTVLVACNDSPHGEAALGAGIAEASRRRLPLAVLVLNPGRRRSPPTSRTCRQASNRPP